MSKPKVLEKKTYTDLAEYQRDWMLGFRRAGHKPEKRDGSVNIFAYTSGDYHNGPRCTSCGEGWCWHCTAPWDIEQRKCGGGSHKRKVERDRENVVLAEAAAIRKRRRSTARS